jgi:hypothetical protein
MGVLGDRGRADRFGELSMSRERPCVQTLDDAIVAFFR